MDQNDRPQTSQGGSPEGGPIEERLVDDQQEGQQNIVDAANEAFVRDQKNPAHPSRIERSHGVEDPSHSVGSTRHGPGERDFNEE